MFSSLSSWQADPENIFYPQINLFRFASERKRILHFLQFSLFSFFQQNLTMINEVCRLLEGRMATPRKRYTTQRSDLDFWSPERVLLAGLLGKGRTLTG